MTYPSSSTYPGASTFPGTAAAPVNPGTGTAATLTVYTDAAPCPRVEVLYTDLLDGTEVINLYRIADGRQMLVRGGVLKYAVGGAAVLDFEAPFGVVVTYRAEMFSDPEGTLSLGFTDSASVTVGVKDTWIHQPLQPSLAFSPVRLQGTASTLTRKTPGELVYPEGAEVGSWIGQQRQGLVGVAFDLLTHSAAADTLQAALSAYGQTQIAVLCIRTPPPQRLPRVFFAAISQLNELEADLHTGGSLVEFTFTADEAAPPAAGLVATPLRRMDIDAAYPTRAARAAAYLTRLDRDRDYSLAGLAG